MSDCSEVESVQLSLDTQRQGELSWNPLLDEWRKVNPPFVKGQSRWDRSPTTIAMDRAAFHARGGLIREYAFSVPTAEAISTVIRHAPSIIEMGAGTGYWARILTRAGSDVVAFDAIDPGSHNEYMADDGRGQRIGRWFNVQSGLASDASRYRDLALLLMWPPYDDSMAADTVASWDGHTLIYAGESEGGCTADDRFFSLVSAGFEEIECVQIPQWYGINDWLWIYQRKSTVVGLTR
jgi:hypothetical protein